MQLIRRLNGAAGPAAAGIVATIGTYDGFHLGHRRLLEKVLAAARSAGRRSLLVTFEPMPREYFAPSDPPPRLTTFRERWRLLERTGLGCVCALRFARELRQQSGRQFAENLASAGVKQIVVGHDFRSGRDGQASAQWLQANGPALGFEVEIVPPVTLDGERVSSRGVREALGRGELERAAVLLGRRYSMVGRVIRGQQLGRTLGFPTANLRLGRRRSPTDGIFAVRVHGVRDALGGDAGWPGVASLGTRPTVNGTVPLLEAHLFDFDGDLYGREIEVEFVRRLRDEERFASLDAMVVQMHRDAENARAILAQVA